MFNVVRIVAFNVALSAHALHARVVQKQQLIRLTDEILHRLRQLHSATEQAARPAPPFQCCWHSQKVVQDFGHSNMFANKGP